MKKENWALLISVAALALAGYAALVCNKRIEADWMGILVGILALLTTALIGWQVLTIWNIKEIHKEIKEEKGAISLRSEENEIEINATLVLFYRELLKTSESEDLVAKFLMSYLYLILHESNVKDIQRCEREILSFSKDVEKLKVIPIRKEYKEGLYRILTQICSKSPIRNTHILIDAFHELTFYDLQSEKSQEWHNE